MTIVETTPKEYDLLFGNKAICYNTAAFNALNGATCEGVRYLLFKDTKIRLGLILGLKRNCLCSPFSAPFGGFSTLDEKISVQHVEVAVDALKEYGASQGIDGLNITLPPLMYGESFLSKVQHVLFQKGFNLDALDLNYIFYPKDVLNDYSANFLARNARKNLNIALSKEMAFRPGGEEKDLMAAYEIIRLNRASKGFPLSMTLDEVMKTASIVRVDSFLVSLEGKDIASAIVYRVTGEIVQVIYWGDLPEYALNKTMNYLSFKVFEYYQQAGLRFIDVGTAMLDQKPNYGLCEFKESIGCAIQPKSAFSFRFTD